MSLPGNGIFVVQGEMAMLVTSMRRSTRWGSHSFPNEEYDVLMRTFQDLKAILNQEDDLRNLDPATYLGPFLEVIRSKETTGPVTSLALSAINKFLSYGLIDPTHPSVPAIVDDIADAVTHARFVGTDHSSDGVVLMKILQVLRTLMLSPEGALLTDESVCEIMLSCFRICFETRLTELLRRNAEQCLRDMTQLIFMRLPQFPPEDASALTFSTVGLSLKKRDKSAKKKSLTGVNSTNSLDRKSPILEQSSSSTGNIDAGSDVTKGESALRHSQDKNLINEAEITIEPVEAKSPGKKHARHSSMDLAAGNPSITQLLEKCVGNTEGQVDTQTDAVLTPDAQEQAKEADSKDDTGETDGTVCVKPSSPVGDGEGSEGAETRLKEYVNPRGIRFMPQDARAAPQPYGLVCVRELFRFLISLCNPLEGQNTSGMVHLGLSLVGTALELAADQLPSRPALYRLVRDPLCSNLVTLLSTERISIFALDLQVSFLLFESLRFHLKFQMEAFFKKLIEIISTDTTKAIYELKEIHHLTLESLSQMFRIPGLCTELYLNYDCDVYCMNVFEEITKLLSKNVVSSTAYNIHELSLQTLLTILEAIEMGTQAEKLESKSETDVVLIEGESETKFGRGGHVSLELGGMDDASVVSDPVTHDISHYIGGRTGRHKPSSSLPTEAELDNIRNMKKWVTQGTELFNQKPERGIEFLQEHGVLKTPLDPHEVSMFLRENPDLDKKMIGEYICKRSSRGEEDEGPSVLGAFAASFDYAGLRIDQALRLYLETFRLPGEAPLIFLVMERFAERWHTTNGEPFANTDAAFRLAYAVIMLNMDQHNHNAKKLNVPMTAEDFVRNLRGCNGNGDFDQAMLEEIYHSIKNEEMVMPAERVGPVRDAYLWRVLQRRGLTAGAVYRAAPPRHAHHARLFAVACPPIVTALSAAFERAQPPTPEELTSGGEGAALTAAAGLERVAALVARSGAAPRDAPTLDTLALTLAKFTGLLAAPHANYITVGVTLGQSTKAQLALRRVCAVAARHADYLRDSWRHLLEIVKTLYIGRLLPKCMVEAEDYLAPNGTVSLIREAARGTDAGLLSSLYSYIALGESGMRAPTPHEKSLIDIATECVTGCNLPGLLVTETKFLQLESLQELVHAMVTVGTPPDSESLQLNPQLEDITIFFLELLGQTLIQNRDRSLSVWETASAHYRRVVFWAATRSAATLRRAVTALLRTGARLMRCHHCAAAVLQHLQVLMQLPYRLFYQQADVHLQVLMQLPYRLFYQQADVISYGLYEVVKTSAQNIHSAAEWRALLALLCAAGAGAWPDHPPAPSDHYNTASSRSEGSDDDSEVRRPTSASSESELSHSPQQGWILVKNEPASSPPLSVEGEGGWWEGGGLRLRRHRAEALARCCEALALVVRDVAHVTPYNCRAAVHAVRLFARAALQHARCCEALALVVRDVAHVTPYNCRAAVHAVRLFARAALQHAKKSQDGKKQRSGSARRQNSDSSDEEVDTLDQYHMVSIQLLDLMHTLHSRTAQIFKWWHDEADQGQGAEEYDLWEVAWMPLLQGIAEFCTDRRKQVANSAIAYLQRALLVPGLSPGAGTGAGGAGGAWEACFQRVLFPLLEQLPRRKHTAARANTIMCKVFLQHLSALSPRPSFPSLWARVIQVQASLVHAGPAADDALTEAALESLKNMVLVMDSVRIFSNGDTYNDLWYMTWEKIGEFLPNLKDELFPQAKESAPANTTLPVASLVPAPNSTPSNVPSPHTLVSPSNPIQIQSPAAHSPVALSQSPPVLCSAPTLVAPTPINPGIVTPTPINPGIVTPAPITPGMVPIRNPLYDQTGLTSSVLLQPLNEMISTPIGISIQSQMPILYPQTTTELLQTQGAPVQPSQTELNSNTTESTLPQNLETAPDKDIQQGELFAEYLTNPYHETKDLSTKEATLYDPESLIMDRTDDEKGEIRNPLLSAKQKSLSANTTPMHTANKAQFGSSDNVRQEGSVFNFTSYFGSVNERNSEVFDTLMATQEG